MMVLTVSLTSFSSEIDLLKDESITFFFNANTDTTKNEEIFMELLNVDNGDGYSMIENTCIVSKGPIFKGDVWVVDKVEPDENGKRLYLKREDKDVILHCYSLTLGERGIQQLELTKNVIRSIFENKIGVDDYLSNKAIYFSSEDLDN